MTLVDLMFSVFSSNNKNVAIRSENEVITYKQLNEVTNKYANYLIDKCEDKFVGVYINASIEAVIAIISIVKAGKAYVPIDTTLPDQKVEYIINNSDLTMLLTSEMRNRKTGDSKSLITDKALSKVEINIEFDINGEVQIENHEVSMYPSSYPSINVTSLDEAYMIYTSGSTGNPKGVVISQKNITKFLIWNQKEMNYTPKDVIAQNHSLSFDNSVWEIFSSLIAGAELVIIQENKNLESLIENIKQHGITSLSITPSQLTILIEYCDILNEKPLSSLKYLFVGSEKVPTEIVKRAFSFLNTGCRVFNEYGPTEVTITSAMLEVGQDTIQEFLDLPSLPIGVPTASNVFEIINEGDYGDGEGELYIGGDCVAIGYYNDEKKNASSFVNLSDVTYPGKYYKTGDVVKRLNDGSYIFIERTDDQVKIRGYRVELGEVEKALRKLDLFDDVVVVAVDDKNISTRMLVCYFTSSKIKYDQKNIIDIRKQLNQILPDYMVPTTFQQLNHIPLNHNKKVDRKLLSSTDYLHKCVKGLSDQEVVTVVDDEIKILNTIEEVIQKKITDSSLNFYELGGDSLKCAKLVARLKNQGYSIDFSSIIHSKSINDIIHKSLNNNKTVKATGQFLVRKPRAMKLNKMQSGILVDSMKSEKNAYFQQIIFSVDHPMKEAILEKSLNQIFNKYKTLISQVELENTYFVFTPTFDMTDVVEFQSSESFDKTPNGKKYNENTFDIFSSPLFNLKIMVNDYSTTFEMSYHHVLLDGTSLNNIVNEIFYAYYNIEQNAAFQLEEEQINAFEVSDILEKRPEKIIYLPNMSLFKDFELVDRTEELTVEFMGDDYLQIERFCSENKITINSFFFTMYVLLITRKGKSNDVSVGFSVDGRNPEIEGIYDTVGCLTQTLLYENDAIEFEKMIDKHAFISTNTKLQNLISDSYDYNISLKSKNLNSSVIDSMYSFYNYNVKDTAMEKFNVTELSSSDFVPYLINFNVMPTLDGMTIRVSYDKSLNLNETFNQILNEVKELMKPNVEGAGLDEFNLIPIIEEITGSQNIEFNQTFFEVGMNSISLAILIRKLKNKDINLTFSEIMEHQKIGDLIGFVQKKNNGMTAQPIGTLQRREIVERVEMTDTQQEMLFQINTSNEKDLYCQQAVYTFSDKFNHELIKQAVEHCIGRNPTLRSTIEIHDGVPSQTFFNEGNRDSFKIYSKKLNGEKLEDVCSREKKLVSDFERGSLFSVAIFEEEEKSNHFVVTFNHLILDGFSCDVVLHEIFDYYFDDKRLLEENKAYIQYLKDHQNQNVESDKEIFWSDFLKDSASNVFKSFDKNYPEKIVNKKIQFQKDSLNINGVSSEIGATTNSILLALLFNSIEQIGINKPRIGLISSGRTMINESGEPIVGNLIRMLPFSAEVKTISVNSIKKVQDSIFDFLSNDDISLGQVTNIMAENDRVLFDIAYSYEVQNNQSQVDSYEDSIISINGSENIGIPLNINVHEQLKTFDLDISFNKEIEHAAEEIINKWIELIRSITVSDLQSSAGVSSTEKIIKECWQEVIGSPIIIEDNGLSFFDVGGNSILLFRVQKLLTDRYGIEISLPELLANPTVAKLSDVIKKKAS
ncbi:non-ribosomal peptide synthetase [Exiguobacterium sp. s189]|uniref:non-ribosomal peptide synthetase n=1 Tax=Exiguobacterium sp. s189 TaxID=2751263 RepID=UPI001BEA3C20|nr:non-ribosomal peptide synthetase [Exiguobacterium sp. s189]